MFQKYVSEKRNRQKKNKDRITQKKHGIFLNVYVDLSVITLFK